MVMEQKAVLKKIIQISMADKNNLLENYGGEPYPPLQKIEQSAPSVKVEADYKAMIEIKRGNRTPRFKIVDAKGVSYGCSYSHLLDWVFTPPSLLTINTTTRIFTIEGKHLEHIERLLLDERIKELHVYNPERHIVPEEGKTVIEILEIHGQ